MENGPTEDTVILLSLGTMPNLIFFSEFVDINVKIHFNQIHTVWIYRKNNTESDK